MSHSCFRCARTYHEYYHQPEDRRFQKFADAHTLAVFNQPFYGTVDKIECEVDQYKLRTIIDAHKNKYLNDIIYSINANRCSYVHYDFFNVDLIQNHTQLVIDITMKSNNGEEIIYANRFV